MKPVSGACGSSNGGNFYSAPSSNLCSAGSASSTGTWTWNCNGSNGGSTASCSANQSIDGVCSATHYNCNAGASANNGGDAATWTWNCNGSNGGSNASCSEYKPPTCSISADNPSIAYNSSTTIRWSSTNTTGCTVSSPGWTGTSGSQSTGNLTSTTTYNLSCPGLNGSTCTGQATVTVGAPATPTLTCVPSSSGVTWNWNTGSDPLSYWLQVWDDVWKANQWYSGPTVTTTGTSCITYYGHVLAGDGNQSSNWSNTASCTVLSANPSIPTLASPANTATLGNASVTFQWNPIASWGWGCPTNVNSYKVYADTSATPTTQVCSVNSATTTCTVTLTDQTNYNWKVVASNGTTTASSLTWNFWIKQPVISGTLYEDANQDACYQNPGENVVSVGTITVSANGSACAKPTATTYNCVIPINGSALANLSSASFNPPYTSLSGCSTGTNSCGINNCSPTINPGDNLTINLGFSVKPWFQTDSCSVSAGNDIISSIPSTPVNYDTGLAVDKYFVLNKAGVVSAGGTFTFGPFGQASLPNYQISGYSTSLSQYKYSFFKQKLLNKTQTIGPNATVTLGSGKLNDGINPPYDITNNSVWDINGNLEIIDDTGLNTINSVVLVSGTITVSSDFKPANSSFAFVSGGNITVRPAVAQINGIYLTDANFSDGATANQGLKVFGSVGAQNQINLQRNWLNPYKPTEYFSCDPSLFINLSSLLGTPSINWTEVAP